MGRRVFAGTAGLLCLWFAMSATGAMAYWNHDAYFDYVDRWVAEAKDGTVDPKTLAPTGYDPFAGAGAFVQAMWQAYRPKADEIGAETIRKAASQTPGP